MRGIYKGYTVEVYRTGGYGDHKESARNIIRNSDNFIVLEDYHTGPGTIQQQMKELREHVDVVIERGGE